MSLTALRRAATHLIFALSLFSLAAAPARAQKNQQLIPVPQVDPGTLGQPGFKFETGVPQVVTLIPHGVGARNGHLWIGNTGHSIRIVGEVDGPEPDWPANATSILSKDHVEVWLAGPADVALPPLVWSQSVPNGARKAEECKDLDPTSGGESHSEECRDWFRIQTNDYRPAFNRLFTRQWLLANNLSSESYATPAYAVIAQKYKTSDAGILEPHGNVQFRSQSQPGKAGYLFEIDIPYTAFPPLDGLEVSQMRLMIDVFSAAPAGRREGGYSTTSSARAYAKADSFNRIQLNPPLQFQISPCKSALQGKVTRYSPTFPEWFIPSADAEGFETQTFLVEDVRMPNDDPPDYSPTVFPLHNFWRSLGTSEWVCGPNLAYRNGDAVRPFGMDISLYDYDRHVNVSEDGFAARKGPDGGTLIKVGPRVWNAAGNSQCGACPRTELKILALGKNLNLITLLNIEDVISGGSRLSQDFTVSPDWSQIVEYDQSENADRPWSSVTYCLAGGRYTKCDQKENVQPPNPPLIRQLLDDNH